MCVCIYIYIYIYIYMRARLARRDLAAPGDRAGMVQYIISVCCFFVVVILFKSYFM